ncbi:MAG: M28 family peptidase, partial [Solirubrobacteraceae bacterium]
AGQRLLSTVIAQRPGSSGAAGIVILAHRDATAAGSPSGLSGTAVLLELARVLASRETARTITLVSTSGGSGGDAGVQDFTAQVPRPLDGAIVLGDLTSSSGREPSVVSYSDGLGGAPLALTATVAHALAAQFGPEPPTPGLAAQFAHLAFPLAVGEQAPLDEQGIAAVLVGAGGEGASASSAAGGSVQIENSGRAVLSAIDALDGGGEVGAPQSELLLGRDTIPPWAIRLLVGALMLPLLLVAIDALARVRRRRERTGRWVLWVLSCALPFLLCVVLAILLGLAGVGASPPAPVAARAAPLDGSAWSMLIALAAVFTSVWFWRPVLLARLDVSEPPTTAAAAVAVLLVLVICSVVVWVANPFAAALLVFALHPWLLLISPELRPGRWLGFALLLFGLLPCLLLVLYYASALGAGPVEALWIAVLMLTGGHLGILAGLLASILCGAILALALIVVRGRLHTTAPVRVSIRGPITYAGPGSLGGTESALHR